MTDCPFDPDTVVHGDASGVDQIGGVWAQKIDAECETHPVPEWAWEQIGRKAGPLRNQFMVNSVDAVVAIWDGESSGTKDTIRKAAAKGLPLYKVVVSVDDSGSVERVELRDRAEGNQQILHDYE